MFCFPITISVTNGCVFGFLFREACAHVVPSMGLSMGKLCPQEGVESEWLLVARDRFDRQHQQNMSFRRCVLVTDIRSWKMLMV